MHWQKPVLKYQKIFDKTKYVSVELWHESHLSIKK